MVLFSCKSNPTNPDVLTPSGNAVKGTLVMYDEFRRKQSDCSRATVTITKGSSSYVGTVTIAGTWEIADVPAGIYTITAAAPGYNGLNLSDYAEQKGVQYVGKDVLEIAEFRLGRDYDTNFITSGDVDFTWRYNYRGEDPKVVTDSTAIVKVKFVTKNPVWKSYWVYLAASPSADCSERIARVSSYNEMPINGDTVTMDVSSLYNAAATKYGKTSMPLLYLQVRVDWGKRSPVSGTDAPQCLTPLVIPIQF